MSSAAATRPLERRSDVAPRRPDERPSARHDPRHDTRQRARVQPTAPRPLRKRREHRPLPADLASVAQVQVFKPRIEAERNISRAPRVARTSNRAHLRSVPQRRRFASILAPALVLVFLSMLGITTFQTRMAQDQVQLDQTRVKVDRARALHQQLERQQAELRSPVRLGRAAATMKMVPADAVGFVSVSPEVYTSTLSSAGQMSPAGDGSTP